jgi:Concanavalin A-like lectin/glucanases superfamily
LTAREIHLKIGAVKIAAPRFLCSVACLFALAGMLAHCPNASAALVPYRSAVLADGAVAYYEFDETAGTTATDSSGGDNNGTYLGGYILGEPAGRAGLGSAVNFNGSNARVRIPDSATFDLGTGAFSIELWFNSDSNDRGDLFTYKGAGGDFGLHSGSQAANTVSYFHNSFRTNPAALSGDPWHYLVATRDAFGAVTLYLDGSIAQTGTDSDTMNIVNDLLIGANHDGDPGNLETPFNGSIDEVAIYPVALSAGQVSNHFNLASVPEPSAVSLLLCGLAPLFARRRLR